jgi:hypothetical protein
MPRTAGTQKIGEAQELFAQKVKMRRQQLEGHFSPFTIINFNPLALRLEGLFKRYCVPSPDDERLPVNVKRVSMKWRGQERMGHALTIREPLLTGRMAGAKQAGGPGEVVPEQEVAEYLPIAIAYAFLEHYSPIFATKNDGMAAAPPKDARRMYGVLAFEGDEHALAGSVLEKSGRNIKIPLARVQTLGKLTQRFYESVDYSLDEYLDRMFLGQRQYADAVISRAQQKFTEGKGREEISSADRVWYRWAIRMGYAAAPTDPDKTWLNELLSLNVLDGAQEIMLRKCPQCRNVEPEPDTPFCPKCNAPMDVFKTFMAGHPVPEVYLAMLEGEQREQAIEEYERRQAAGAAFGGKHPKARRGARAADEIPAASSTATPGDDV